MARIWIFPGPPGRIAVQFPYKPGLNTKIKTVPEYQWHPSKKCWTVPHTEDALETLLTLFAGERVYLDPVFWATQDVVNHTLKALEDELKLRGYSPKTRKMYCFHIRRYRK